MKGFNVSIMLRLLASASRFLARQIKLVFVGCLAAIVLTSCGGGGGGGAGPVTSTLAFPLQSGMRASVANANGSSINFSVSGTCSGTASIAISTPVPATFGGVPGVSVANTAIISLPYCHPPYIASTSTDYYDSNYDPLGTIGSSGDYSVYSTPPSIPGSVKVGGTGTIGARNNYSGNTTTTPTGQDVISYMVEPDTANTAIVNMIDRSYDLSDNLTSTEQDRSRITADGTLIPVSADLQYANGSTTHLVFTAIPDTTPPTVLSINPLSNSTAVSVATAITATFSELIDPATVTTAEFTLMNGTIPVSGAVTHSGTTATFTPAAFLTPNAVYTAKITTGVKDLAGNATSSNYSWSFTTGAPDTTPPTVSYTSPANSASAVAINTAIAAVFGEAMNPATVTTAEFTLMNGTTPISGAVTYSGTAATFTPSAPLAYNTLYTATISTGVKDLVGNAMSSNYSWQFTTTAFADITPPAVLSTSPANYASAVAINIAIAATFSEAMDPATVTTVQFTLMNGTIPVSGAVTYSGTTAIFTPSAPLAYNTLYTARITTGVKDLAGNAMSSNYSWLFTTTAAPDITPPTVLSTSPANSASAVAINTAIAATFSEAMDSATVTTAEFTLMNGTIPVSGAVTYSGTTATFTPAASLAYDTLYTATITTGVKDLAGNAMALTYTWSFTSDKKINGLNFTVIDAEYSKSLDKIVMVSSVPGNQLHIYDPVTDLDTTVTLNLTPTSVSVSPDGLFAAVGHNAWISYVDLSTATLVKTLPVSADVFDIVLVGNGYVYAFPRIDQWVQIHGINISTGAETLSSVNSIRAGTKAKLNAGGTAIYGVTNGLSPDNIEKYDISAGAPAYAYRSPYWGTYPVCGDLWTSEDGFRIFTRCGNVFNATSLQATDMVYGGALQNLGLVRHMSHSSAIGKVIAIPDNGYGITSADTEIRIFVYNFLTFEQSIKLPHFVVGNNQYAGHGRFVFYNSNGTKSFVVLQADASSGMLYDYGVVTY
jgi:hypothetical protein